MSPSVALGYGSSSRLTHLTFWVLILNITSSFINFISLFFLTLTFFCSAFFLSPTCLFLYFPHLLHWQWCYLGKVPERERRHLAPSIPRCVERLCSPKLPSAPSLQGYNAKSCNIIRRRVAPLLGDSDHATQLSEFLFPHMLKKMWFKFLHSCCEAQLR